MKTREQRLAEIEQAIDELLDRYMDHGGAGGGDADILNEAASLAMIHDHYRVDRVKIAQTDPARAPRRTL
jgi:hypothetical protein